MDSDVTTDPVLEDYTFELAQQARAVIRRDGITRAEAEAQLGAAYRARTVPIEGADPVRWWWLVLLVMAHDGRGVFDEAD